MDGKTGDGKPVDGADADQDAIPTVDAFTGDGLTVDGKNRRRQTRLQRLNLQRLKNQKHLRARRNAEEADRPRVQPHAVELPPQFDPERFVAFCDMRLTIAKPMSVQALKAFVTKHKKHSREVLDEAFDSAIVASWQDLYST